MAGSFESPDNLINGTDQAICAARSKTARDIARITEQGLNELNDIWNAVHGSSNEKAIIDCYITVQNSIQDVFNEMVAEEEEKKDMLIKKIEDALKEHRLIQKELGLPNNQPSVVLDISNMMPLLEVDSQMQQALQEYRNLKHQRLEMLTELKKKEKDLCDALEVTKLSMKFVNGSIPTEEELVTYETHINSLEADKAALAYTLRETRPRIIELMKLMDITPVLQFELQICQDSDEAIAVIKKNADKMKDCYKAYSQQLEMIKTEVGELINKLNALWDRLGVDDSYRKNIQFKFSGYSKAAVKGLKQELERCEQLKRLNIKNFVDHARSELVDLWDICCKTDEERSEFQAFYSDCYNEEILELHELEIDNLKRYYSHNEEIFHLAGRRRKLWSRMNQLEQAAKNPGRFNNRGGQLLKEERERKTIQKDLPIIESELEKRLKVYRQREGKPFLYFGEDLGRLLKMEWEQHLASKDNQKIARKLANAQTLEVESKLGCRPHVTSANKRKCPGTPHRADNVSSKLLKATVVSDTSTARLGTINHSIQIHSYKPIKACRNLQLSSKPATTTSRNRIPAPVHYQPEIMLQRSPTASSNVSISPTYSNFQDYLEKSESIKTPCRSTLKPGPGRMLRSAMAPGRCVLQEVNTPATSSPYHTPLHCASRGTTPKLKLQAMAAKSPYSCPRMRTDQQSIPIKSPYSCSRTRANLQAVKSPKTAPKLTRPRGQLPIII